MDPDRIKGRVRSVAGSVEEQYGRVAGDDEARADGLADQLAGRSQAIYGQAKDSLRDQVDRGSALAEEAYDRGRRAAEQGAQVLNRQIEANPVVAILVAGALGYLFGIMAGRRRR